MEYDYGFEYAFPDAMEGAAEGFATGVAGVSLGIFAVVYLLMLAFSVVTYVLYAVGLYRIAKRRGIHHAWLAWIPVGSEWLLGSIADHYQYVAKHKVTKRRKVMLTLSIILWLIIIATIVSLVGMVLAAPAAEAATTASDMGGMIAMIALMVVCWLGYMGVGIALMVFYYIAAYDLFRSCKPSYDVLFLVFGILFSVTMPFFVFACSGSDAGMPVRRQRPAPQIPYEQPCQPEPPVVETELVDDQTEL